MRERNITRTVVINHITAYVFDKTTKAMKESELEVMGQRLENHCQGKGKRHRCCFGGFRCERKRNCYPLNV